MSRLFEPIFEILSTSSIPFTSELDYKYCILDNIAPQPHPISNILILSFLSASINDIMSSRAYE